MFLKSDETSEMCNSGYRYMNRKTDKNKLRKWFQNLLHSGRKRISFSKYSFSQKIESVSIGKEKGFNDLNHKLNKFGLSTSTNDENIEIESKYERCLKLYDTTGELLQQTKKSSFNIFFLVEGLKNNFAWRGNTEGGYTSCFEPDAKLIIKAKVDLNKIQNDLNKTNMNLKNCLDKFNIGADSSADEAAKIISDQSNNVNYLSRDNRLKSAVRELRDRSEHMKILLDKFILPKDSD